MLLYYINRLIIFISIKCRYLHIAFRAELLETWFNIVYKTANRQKINVLIFEKKNFDRLYFKIYAILWKCNSVKAY